MSDIDNKVDRVLSVKGLNETRVTRKRSMGGLKRGLMRKSLFGIPIAGWLLIGAVGAVLISGFSWYNVTIESPVSLNGSGQLALFFDGELLTAQESTIDADITTLDSGDTQTFTHTMESPADDGDYLVFFDVSAMDDVFNNPLNTWYGFYFDIQDTVTHESIMDDTLVVLHGADAISFDFVYSLDSHFLATSDPLPFSMLINASLKPNEAPVGVGESVSYPAGTQNDILVTSNDYDPDLDDFVIISVTKIGIGSATVVSFDDDSIIIDNGYQTGPNTFEYIIEDEHGLQSAPITLIVTVTA